MKIKLFTHTDLDGVGCAIVAYRAFGKENVDVEYCNYNEINEKVHEFLQDVDNVNTYDRVYITDISVNADVAQEIEDYYNDGENGNNDRWSAPFYLFDHHPTAKHLDKYDWAVVIVNESSGDVQTPTCGTKLMYDILSASDITHSKLCNNATSMFITAVRDYDTWRWVTIEGGMLSSNLNDLHQMYGCDEFIDWTLKRLDNDIFPAFDDKDIALLEFRNKEINDYIDEKMPYVKKATLFGHRCGVVFADRFINDLGHTICQKHRDIEFAVMIDMDKKSVSYRSEYGDLNLGTEIASKMGGGGHPRAAGSRISEDEKNRALLEIFNNLEY